MNENITQNIENFCKKFNEAIRHGANPTKEEENTLDYFTLDFAKAIIQDFDSRNAETIAKIILGYVE